jgi:hypothetical protein
MHCADRGRTIFSAEPNESQGWVASWDEQEVPRPAHRDTGERYLSYGITRAEIIEYLNQTYGPVFVENLVKHLAQSR